MVQRYSGYKNSGVEWIDDVPESWSLGKLKNYSELRISSVDKHIYEDERQVIVCNYTDVYYNEFITNKLELRKGSCSEEEYSKFKLYKGDVIITKDSESPTDIGVPSLVKDDFDNVVCGYHLSIIKPYKNKLVGGFLFRQLQTKRIRSYFEVCSNGITRFGLGKSSVLDTPLIIPPLSEQQQIVKYLDDKTQKIDNLIKQKEKKIELLKEKRTSLINHVVTKGLNPNVEMKDSGVEWIGEIPKHWNIKKLKHIIDENTSSLPNSTNPNYELEYIEISDVNSEGKINSPTQYLFSDSPSRCRRIVKKGDLIVSTVRTYLKSIGLIENDVQNLICSTGFSVLSPKQGVVSKHLFYMLRTEWFISMVISYSEGVSYPSIQSDKLINIPIIHLSVEEQQQIVDYLDEQTKEIDDLVELEQKKIELLKEYRQSLISEVVTGKIRVCEEDLSEIN